MALTLSIFLLFWNIAYATELEQIEIDALLDIYNTTNGNFWNYTKWNVSHIIDSQICTLPQYNTTIWCEEFNLTDNSSQYYVTELIFDSNHLVGSLPSSIGNFEYLENPMGNLYNKHK